ncbi:MAG: glycosyltransferase family 9 protein [Crocinitomicaceae bacterium]|nr:glycosyltransferase family 9 protein [Crocinitomicaceae bacterium]
MISNPKHIVISRTDSIGDVCLTLPLAGILKNKFPECKISFLGNTYTKPVIETCTFVDEIWEWATLQQMSIQEQIAFLSSKNIDTLIHVFPRKEIAQLAKKAGIKNRIGTSHRFFHLFTCNHRPSFTRKNSDLHESQLNVKLLSPFGIDEIPTLTSLQISAGFSRIKSSANSFIQQLKPGKCNIILHPKSQGSAREWAIENFIELAQTLDGAKYEVFFTGTEKEGQLFRNKIPVHDNVHDLTGKMNLDELIGFISKSDALIAASTGPLHLAGLANIKTIGLFSTQRPTHAVRWQPLGNKVVILEEKIFSDSNQPLNIPLRDVAKALENGTA